MRAAEPTPAWGSRAPARALRARWSRVGLLRGAPDAQKMGLSSPRCPGLASARGSLSHSRRTCRALPPAGHCRGHRAPCVQPAGPSWASADRSLPGRPRAAGACGQAMSPLQAILGSARPGSSGLPHQGVSGDTARASWVFIPVPPLGWSSTARGQPQGRGSGPSASWPELQAWGVGG